jgi:glycosyltransferase involved in cell wall biosynthesis
MMAGSDKQDGGGGKPLRIGLVSFEGAEPVSGHDLYLRQVARALGALGAPVDWMPIDTQGYGLDLLEGFGMDIAESLAVRQVDVFLVDQACHAPLRRWSRRQRGPRRIPRQVAIVQDLKSRGPGFWSRLAWPAELRFLAAMDGCVFASAAAEQAVAKMLGRRKSSVLVRPGTDHLAAGLDEQQIQARVTEPKRLRLLFLGHVTADKGLHHLLRALERWPNGPWLLDVAGSLTLEPAYVAKIRQHLALANLEDRVELHGVVQDELLRRLLGRSHAMVVPAAPRGIGMAYLEGMGFGLPVVATAGGPAAELIRHGEEGYLVNPNDPLALIEAIQPWARDRTTLLRMSLAARRRSLEQPSWHAGASQLLAWLPSVLGLNH